MNTLGRNLFLFSTRGLQTVSKTPKKIILAWVPVFPQRTIPFHEIKTAYWQHKLGNLVSLVAISLPLRSRRKDRWPWTPLFFRIYLLNSLRLTIGTNESIRSNGWPMQVKQVTCQKKKKQPSCFLTTQLTKWNSLSLSLSFCLCGVDGQLRHPGQSGD